MNPKKEKLFSDLKPRVEKLLATNTDSEIMSTQLIDLLADSVPHFHWTGIYWLRGNMLHLGPYRGKPTDHTQIAVGQGICGRAVAENQSIVVDDVTKESNYLACSLETRSEIVVPIYSKGKIVGEIDIDSDIPKAFDEEDRVFLESVAELLGKRLNP